jgi:hypothetical protein
MSEIRAVETFIEYSVAFLEEEIPLAKPRWGSKPRTDFMWDHKMGLYWWAVRAIEEFPSIGLQWHTQMNAAVTLLGIKYDLETAYCPKNNLTDAEFVLFFKQLLKFETGVANWKQHYLAWVLT